MASQSELIGPRSAAFPRWNHLTGKIVFSVMIDNRDAVASIQPDGSAYTVLVRGEALYPVWSPSGRFVAYCYLTTFVRFL